MKKVIQVLLIAVLAVSISPSFVLSQVSVDAEVSATQASANARARSTDEAITARAKCNQAEIRRERIKCRLEKRIEERESSDTTTLPEACRRLAQANTDRKITRAACLRLFNSVRPCYFETGREKLMCLRRASGLSEEGPLPRQADETPIRNYLVSLLEDLEERLEYAVEQDNLSAEQAAPLIEQIVEIKEDILNGETREVLRPKLRQLKADIQALKVELRSQQPTDTEAEDE